MTQKENRLLAPWRPIALWMMSLLCGAGCRSAAYTNEIHGISRMERRPSIYVDEERLASFEKLQVGDIPASATNLMEYLVWINECVDRAGLPQQCHVGFRLAAVGRWSINMMNADMIVCAVSEDPVWFHDLGIEAPKESSIKHGLRERNMREFLWLLRGVYSLRIEYDAASITFGYGWSWDHMITRQRPDGKGEGSPGSR